MLICLEVLLGDGTQNIMARRMWRKAVQPIVSRKQRQENERKGLTSRDSLPRHTPDRHSSSNKAPLPNNASVRNSSMTCHFLIDNVSSLLSQSPLNSAINRELCFQHMIFGGREGRIYFISKPKEYLITLELDW